MENTKRHMMEGLTGFLGLWLLDSIIHTHCPKEKSLLVLELINEWGIAISPQQVAEMLSKGRAVVQIDVESKCCSFCSTNWWNLRGPLSEYKEDKEIAGKSWHKFSKDRLCLNNLTALCN